MTKTNLIKSVLETVDGLKPLPATITKALKLIEKPTMSINDITTTISRDQALAAYVLRFANSAYYSFRYPATTLDEAIVRLGFRRIKNILYTFSYSTMLGRRLASYNLGHGELWQHSVAVAMTSERLAEKVAYPSPDEAYVAGLLHDLGKLMLDQYFKVNWDQLLAAGQTHQLTLIEVEGRLLGLNHAQIGSELARKWDLPPCLIEAIAYHHMPSFASVSPKLAAIIQVADVICWRLGIGLTHPDFLPSPHEETLKLLALSPGAVDDLTELYRDMLSAASTLMDSDTISTPAQVK